MPVHCNKGLTSASGGHAAARCCPRSARTRRNAASISLDGEPDSVFFKPSKLLNQNEFVQDAKIKIVEVHTSYKIVLELIS